MDHEKEIRERIQAFKSFYTNLMTYGSICVASVIVWISTGGPFWPIWVMFGLGIAAVNQGLKLNIFPFLEDVFPFLKSTWEDEQVKKQLETQEILKSDMQSHINLTTPSQDSASSASFVHPPKGE